MTRITGNRNHLPKRESTATNLSTEFISQRSGTLIQWGNILLLSILILLALICWLIRYPEIVNAPAKLTSVNAPKPVVTQVAGKLVKLRMVENQAVVRGEVLGFIESTARHEDVLALAHAIDVIGDDMSERATNELGNFFKNGSHHLGELQHAYQILLRAYLTLSDHLGTGVYFKNREALTGDKVNLRKIKAYLEDQKRLQTEDFLLAQKNFTVNEQLNRSKAISDLEYRNEQSKYLAKQITLPQMAATIIENERQQNEIDKQIMELDNLVAKQRFEFQQAVKTFRSEIDEWKKKYILTAPVSGKVAFASFVQENQQLELNQTLCFINPDNAEYFAEVVIPQNNLGKVMIGQTVILKFPSYPYQEYGSLNGKIDFISSIPSADGYVANVALGNALNTTHQKRVHFREGLVAQGEIVTKDMRLLERFYYNTLSQIVGDM
jgi:multidrug efflux pump subunit AcrA (membrane-fusion protein)